MTTAPGTLTVPTPPATRSQWTTQEWAEIVLGDLGVPVTQNNVDNLLVWMAAENNASSWLSGNDPLNVRNTAAGGDFQFDTVQDGIGATVSTIEQPNMAPILNALQLDASLPSFTAAVVSTPWDAGHYAGTGFAAGTDQPLQAYATGTGGNPTGLLGQATSDVAGGGLGGIGAVLTPLGTLLEDVTSTSWWERIGIFGLGAAVFLIGLVGFIATSDTGQKVESTAVQAGTAAVA
jgi:hypothetical protein